MSARSQRLAFIAFHYTLAAVVFVLSLETVVHTLRAGQMQLRTILMASFAGLETVAALLFVIPGTMKPAGYLLMGIFLFAFVFHALHGEYNLALLVYLAGVVLVLVHGKS